MERTLKAIGVKFKIEVNVKGCKPKLTKPQGRSFEIFKGKGKKLLLNQQHVFGSVQHLSGTYMCQRL